ncbi:DAK2 domain-containing protein [Anaerosinus massiliensis]|uniref:DAK2 domain-containing protein n=1 Tax=Massilibacillus massiliensis TaxID=1806837 RepID=UPI000A403ACF|nr:DAK2 domain-containing protein [Massilibacillus massiliensis]
MRENGGEGMTKNKEVITGNDFKRMIAGAYSEFNLEHEKINQLNVFPVPDGDTGTNMLRTLGAVARAVAEAPQDEGIGSVARRAADSAIMGARGNSGVILSQIFRGIGRGLAGKHEVHSAGLGKAFQYGVLYAYRSVAKPVEGTILTVAKGIAKGAYHAVRADLSIADILEEAIKAGNVELARTPELLPALKAAGVVDAGGRGLIVFLQGCLQGLGGEFSSPELDFEMSYKAAKIMPTVDFEIARPYCTEFMVKNTKVTVEEIRRVLGELGDSLVVADGSDIVKVHIHTGHPGTVLECAVGWGGTLHDIKIDNMADQHRAILLPNASKKTKLKTAIIAVAAGDGLADMMKSLGADIVISGGQSMNPAVEEFIDAVHQDIAEKYIVLPNNSNIILAAAQVKKLLGDRVEIVSTTNTPQGLAALVAYDREADILKNVEEMNVAIKEVKEASLTMAVRDSFVEETLVKEGSYIGVIGGKVKVFGADMIKTLIDTVKAIAGDDSEIISLYYGEDLDETKAKKIAAAVETAFPEMEVQVYAGGQANYHFIMSVE